LKSKPDAIFVTNLDMVLGSVLLLKEKGIKIPYEIGFIGFDDSEWALLLDPALTVVQQPVYQLGETAAEILIKKINGNEETKNILVHVLNTHLIIRQSSVKNNN